MYVCIYVCTCVCVMHKYVCKFCTNSAMLFNFMYFIIYKNLQIILRVYYFDKIYSLLINKDYFFGVQEIVKLFLVLNKKCIEITKKTISNNNYCDNKKLNDVKISLILIVVILKRVNLNEKINLKEIFFACLSYWRPKDIETQDDEPDMKFDFSGFVSTNVNKEHEHEQEIQNVLGRRTRKAADSCSQNILKIKERKNIIWKHTLKNTKEKKGIKGIK